MTTLSGGGLVVSRSPKLVPLFGVTGLIYMYLVVQGFVLSRVSYNWFYLVLDLMSNGGFYFFLITINYSVPSFFVSLPLKFYETYLTFTFVLYGFIHFTSF